jgi:hypothetical protein
MKRPRPFSSVWWQGRGLSAMLGLLVLAIFVVMPLEVTGSLSPLLVAVVLTFLMISGVVATSGRRTRTVVVAAIALASMGVRWALLLSPGETLARWADALGMLVIGLLAVLLLRLVFREGPITSDRIQGAIAVYLLLGLIWTLAYQLLERVSPGSFRLPPQHRLPDVVIDHSLAYYSFVTLTTLGYGDIVPVHPFARSLAMAEALVGQLYPAILIARLVSLQIAARHPGGGSE